MKVVVEVVSGQLVQGPEPTQRVVDDKDVDVPQGVLSGMDDRRGRPGIGEVCVDMRDRTTGLLQLREHSVEAAGVRVLVLGRPRVDEYAGAAGQQPPRDGEADPVPPADAGYHGGSRHGANLLLLWMSCH